MKLFLLRRNPRNLPWTQLYRKQHKKGIEEAAKKQKKRRRVVVERGYVGAPLEQIKAKQNQTPEQRKSMRLAAQKQKEDALKAVNAKKTAKGAATTTKGQQPKAQQAKQPKPQQPKAQLRAQPKGGKTANR